MPLLRITCPTGHTEQIIELLHDVAHAREVAVIPSAHRTGSGDVILADVPRGSIDDLLLQLPQPTTIGELRVSVQASDQLVPPGDADDADDDAVIWAQVIQDVHDTGRLSWMNVLLVVVAAAIAAIGILQDQLLLIVGAMALSPDYFAIVDTSLSVVRRDWRSVTRGLRTISISYSAGAFGAWALTGLLSITGVVDHNLAPDTQFTLFISQPDVLTVIVALLAGVAGALAVTLPDARGLVGVFVSVTTIPAAANIGVALASGDGSEALGAFVQLVVNITSLIVAGVVTLEIRRQLRHREHPLTQARPRRPAPPHR